MSATSSRRSTVPTVLARKAAIRSRRAMRLVIAATVSLLSLVLTGPAFAMTVPHAGEGTPGPAIPVATPTIKVISTGIATWQVALIAAGAALLGAAVVLLARRLHPGRRSAPVSAA